MPPHWMSFAHLSDVIESKIRANIFLENVLCLFLTFIKNEIIFLRPIAQHKADALDNTSKLCLHCPNFDQPPTSEIRLLVGQYQTPYEPHDRENEHDENEEKMRKYPFTTTVTF